MIIHRIEQRSEAWHSIRLGRFTATSFADVMAAKNTSTYENLIARIAGEILTGEEEETYSNSAMERGIELEPEALNYYAELFDVNVDQVGFVTPDENDPLHEWVGVSPDGMIGGNGLIEIKCPLIKTHLKYLFADKLPNEYKWQVQGQLLITGAEYSDFMSYFPNLKPFILRVLPNKEMHDQLYLRLIEAVSDVRHIINIYNQLDEPREV